MTLQSWLQWQEGKAEKGGVDYYSPVTFVLL
jgi:hypothetical protein